jgi:hypothetical protein
MSRIVTFAWSVIDADWSLARGAVLSGGVWLPSAGDE